MKRLATVLPALFALALGCTHATVKTDSDGSTEPPRGQQVEEGCTDASGSRLVFDKLVTSDGLSERIGIVDTELGPCRVSPYEKVDGSLGTYCVPAESSGQVFFNNPICADTDAVVELPEGENATYAARRETTECQSVPSVYRIGSELGARPKVLYALSNDGTCASRAVTASGSYFSSLTRVPASELVALESGAVSKGRMGKTRLEGADGSQICESKMTDGELNANCTLRYNTSGDRICVPDAVRVQTYYSDSACSNLTTGVSLGECPVSRDYATRFVAGACTVFLLENAYRVIDSIVLRPYEEISTGTCETTDERVQLLSEEAVELESFTLVTDSREDDRLNKQFWQAESGFAEFSGTYLDTKLGLECGAERIPLEDEWRCLPRSVPLSTRYTDADCTQLIEVAVGIEGVSCISAPVLTTAISDGVRTFYDLVPHVGTVFELDNRGVCKLGSGDSYFDRGPQATTSTFALFEVKTE